MLDLIHRHLRPLPVAWGFALVVLVPDARARRKPSLTIMACVMPVSFHRALVYEECHVHAETALTIHPFDLARVVSEPWQVVCHAVHLPAEHL